MTELSVNDVTVTFGRGTRAVTVLRDINICVPSGSVLGIVGESGSGKSTLARVVAGLVPPSQGSVALDGQTLGARRSRLESRRVQLAFQDPATALNPRMTVEDTLADACDMPRRLRSAKIDELLRAVGLDSGLRRALPHGLSGGQRQRVSLARAMAAEPDVLICDEVTSALDVSTRGTILNLIAELQQTRRFTLLFISHDIGAVRRISDHVAVMYAGQIVEVAPADTVATAPQHPYTRVLLESVPSLGGAPRAAAIDFEPVDPRDPPPGCRFHPRCPVGPQMFPDREICVAQDPALGARRKVNHATCHFAADLSDPVDQTSTAAPKEELTDRSYPRAGAHDARPHNTQIESHQGVVDVTP